MRFIRRAVNGCATACLFVVLTACQSTDPATQDLAQRDVPDATAVEATDNPAPIAGPAAEPIDSESIVNAYNSRAASIQQIWTRAVLEAEWRENDRRRWEQGDGVLILRKPRDLSLSIGKLGEVMFQIGGNNESYWFFELKPPQGEPTRLTIGRYDEGDAFAAGSEIGIGMRADELVGLLGVTPLPEGVTADRTNGNDNAEYRLDWSDPVRGVDMVWLLDREHRPVSISVQTLGEDDELHLLEADLSRYERLEQSGVARGGWPWVATRIEVRIPERQAVMTLFLDNPSDGVERSRVRDVQFDLDVLRQVYEPQRVFELGGGR